MDKEILKKRTKSFLTEMGKLTGEFNPDKKEIITVLWKEANELLSILVASLITLRKSLLQS